MRIADLDALSTDRGACRPAFCSGVCGGCDSRPERFRGAACRRRSRLAWSYYLAFVALLVVATFIDYDLWIIPDQVTVPGMAIGLAVGCLWPEIRPNPSERRRPMRTGFGSA